MLRGRLASGVSRANRLRQKKNEANVKFIERRAKAQKQEAAARLADPVEEAKADAPTNSDHFCATIS